MKQLYVLRHADKSWTGGISKNGKQACEALKKRLPAFTIVICSQKKRTEETAFILGTRQPDIDNRANIEHNTGTELVNLITETIQNMRDGDVGLIVSHVPCMQAAHGILVPNSPAPDYKELQGFIVNQNLQLKEFR